MRKTKCNRKIRGCRIWFSQSRLYCFNVGMWNKPESPEPQFIHDKIANCYLPRIMQGSNLSLWLKTEQIQSRYSKLGSYSCFSSQFYVTLTWLNNLFFFFLAYWNCTKGRGFMMAFPYTNTMRFCHIHLLYYYSLLFLFSLPPSPSLRLL